MPNYEIKNIYQGGFDSLKPNYGDVPPMATVSDLGVTTDPRVADVLTEVSQKIAPGQKTVELSMVSPEVFEAVPQDQLKEVNRLSKLTGVDVTVHAPVVEPSGMSREGFSETNREATERQMNLAVERAHEVNPDGSSPVTFHSTAILPAEEITKTKDKDGKEREIRSMLVINSDTGAVNKIQTKPRHFPGEGKASIQQELNNINDETWKQQKANFSYRSDIMSHRLKDKEFLRKLTEAEKRDKKELSPDERQAMAEFNSAVPILNDSYRELKNLCEAAHNNGTQADKQRLQQFYNQIQSKALKIQQDPESRESIRLKSDIVEQGIETLNKVSTPEIFKPLNEFSQEKTTTTFANVALNSYKKFGDKAPIISIENPPAGTAFSTGEELRNIVEKSRKKFVDAATKEGMSKGQAQEQAEKLIGVTWDVGHINMLRKSGFSEKDIVEETKKVAPYTKHVHLSDNFGFEHTELPMGKGNVPMKEIMEKLGEKGFEGKKIVEAAQWWQHFKTSPMAESMKAMGSPIYSMEMQPYWNQALGLQQGYMQGLEGAWLPDVNYATWGGSFSQLPMELGGQRPGAEGSRMSGRGME